MAIRFTCPGCVNPIAVHDRLRNREIRCPNCDLRIKVPEASTIATKSRAREIPSPELTREAMVDGPASTIPEALPLSTLPPQTIAPAIASTATESSPLASEAAPKKRKRIETHHEEEDVEWDITPMVDVAFLLLIFFMLTAAFSIQKAIPSSAAPSEEASKSASVQEKVEIAQTLIIQIDEFNGFTVLDTEGQSNLASSKQELYTILSDFKEEYGTDNIKVLIQAHVDSIHGAAVACMDASRQAGFGSFQLQSVEQF